MTFKRTMAYGGMVDSNKPKWTSDAYRPRNVWNVCEDMAHVNGGGFRYTIHIVISRKLKKNAIIYIYTDSLEQSAYTRQIEIEAEDFSHDQSLAEKRAHI